jgi:hypothetical protein
MKIRRTLVLRYADVLLKEVQEKETKWVQIYAQNAEMRVSESVP